MSIALSDRSKFLVQSEIRNMSIECDKLGGINLSQGICDLPIPNEIAEGVNFGIKQGFNQYTRYDGIVELRVAISKKVKKYNKFDVDPEKNIVVSAGATGAFYSACLALLNEGDEVIIFEPYYGYHINTIKAAGAVPKFVKMTGSDWQISFSDLESAVTERTKAIMINTPANPSGKVFTRDELEKLADFAIKHDIFIFTDEIYEYIVYDDREFISPASISRIFDRTILISGYSKTFSITGWRIGYCVCHEKWKDMIGYINDLVYVCAPAPLQFGVAYGCERIPDSFYDNLRIKYQQKRDLICTALLEIGLTPYVPQGAYYVLADVTNVPGQDSKLKAMHILQTTGVACVPGSAFFHDNGGDNLVRFCFAKDEVELREACNRLKNLVIN